MIKPKKIYIILSCLCVFFSTISIAYTDTNGQDDTKVLILMYRGIVKKADGKNVTSKSFKKQMEILKKNGYQSIKLEDLLNFYYDGKPLPLNPVLITFDGGRKDSYLYADKVLKKIGYNAVMFIIPEKINSGDHFFICWHDVKNMLKAKRWEFGPHSEKGYQYITIDPKNNKGPYLLNKAWLESRNSFESDKELYHRIKKEYADFHKKIKKKIEGLQLYAISIPYGNYFYWKKENTFCMSLNRRLARENFKLGFLQGTDGVVTKNEGPLSLGRLIVDGDWTELDFSYHIGLEIPYITSFFDDFDTKELKQQWGTVTGNAYNQNGRLYMNPFIDKNDAFLYLLGSEGIDSCVVEAEAVANPDSQFWIYGKYFDVDNYVRFGMSKGNFYLQRLVNDNIEEQIKSKDMIEDKDESHIYKLVFKKDSVIGILDDSYFGKVNNVYSNKKGIVALETWDKLKNTAGAQLSWFKLQRSANQWACLTPKNETDVSTYKDTFVVSSVFSPLCFEYKDGNINPVSDINLMRMISGHYGLPLIPRIYLSSFNNNGLEDLKLWVSSTFKNYSLAGINIELSDAVSKDVQSLDILTDGLKYLFEEQSKEFVITVNIPPQLLDYYTQKVASKCSYIIVKNEEPDENLIKAMGQYKSLIKSIAYTDNIIDSKTPAINETLAVWEK